MTINSLVDKLAHLIKSCYSNVIWLKTDLSNRNFKLDIRTSLLNTVYRQRMYQKDTFNTFCDMEVIHYHQIQLQYDLNTH